MCNTIKETCARVPEMARVQSSVFSHQDKPGSPAGIELGVRRMMSSAQLMDHFLWVACGEAAGRVCHLPCEQLTASCEQMLCNYKLMIRHDAQEGRGRGPLWEASSRNVQMWLLWNKIYICQLIIDVHLHLGYLADAFIQSEYID